ncbi:hypothetical protein BO71DRAFT_427906 [Aspergillus ellipticus CBS 707.79]|uniref:Uncharacterized protein n=1 Tax=Aspergillus ellipticus CBS 707.79 TaxID=1448320 RepID=A0A319DGW0_9EURO|nr:hypothetical protein BO71DRAFT_427906 [Aspergillus ellipticus CBS 707.79]
MRWTLDNEHLLWRTIFETQSLTLDLDTIADAWPGDDKPTPRAIKEHLEKFRKNLTSGHSVTFSMTTKRPATSAGASPRPCKKRETKKKAPTTKADDLAGDSDQMPADGAVKIETEKED